MSHIVDGLLLQVMAFVAKEDLRVNFLPFFPRVKNRIIQLYQPAKGTRVWTICFPVHWCLIRDRSETLRTQASQLRENCGESIPGRRESKCKSPEMEKGLTPLRKTKEARDLEHGEERGERREERGEKEERGIC